MSFSIAQCPACDSTFQVTTRILESAGGKVRCGACLSIFTAPENLLEPDDELHGEHESVFVGSHPDEFFNPSTFLTRQSLQDALRESQLSDEELQSSDDEEFFAAVEAGVEANEETLEENSPAPEEEPPTCMEASPLVDETDTEVEIAPPEQTFEADEEVIDGDEEEAGQPPASSHSSHSPYSPYSPSQPHDLEDETSPEAFRLHASFSVDTSPYSSSQQDDQAGADMSDTLPPSAEEAEDETLARPEDAQSLEAEQEVLLDWTEVIEGIGVLEVKARQEETSQAPEQPDTTETEAEREDLESKREEELDQSVEAIRARALKAELEDEEALEAIPSENLQALGKFSTPVEIIAGQPRSLRRQLSWAALSLVASLTLGAQYLWQEMDRYSQNSSLRPLYETACEWLDCDLPVYTDIEAIRASNLAVRSHPDVDNALTVNIEFQNFAPFAQRFPVLVLSFNAANNSIIALREFAASEYLPEQLRGRQLMPSQTPLQIDLSIIDPGDDAVNYTLAFRNP